MVGDALSLPFASSTFDVVIDKGTSDSALKEPREGVKMAASILRESVRVLKAGGCVWQITDEDPDVKLAFLEAASDANTGPLTTSYKVVEACGREYFIYLVTKTEVSAELN